MKNSIFRHGDITLKRIDILPQESKEIFKGNSWVAGYGETTGHRHLITAERMIVRQADNGRYYLSLGDSGVLTHEEHKTLTIPAGDIFIEDAYYVFYDCPSTARKYMSGVIKCDTVA
ncbi:MAG: hypothetical protein KGJ58_04550, partial [Patescibacteria group bacterium]|nr:hypothetical protein [Patescibacteria group bacterium]